MVKPISKKPKVSSIRGVPNIVTERMHFVFAAQRTDGHGKPNPQRDEVRSTRCRNTSNKNENGRWEVLLATCQLLSLVKKEGLHPISKGSPSGPSATPTLGGRSDVRRVEVVGMASSASNRAITLSAYVGFQSRCPDPESLQSSPPA